MDTLTPPLPHIRPRFKIITPRSEADIAASFRAQLANSTSGCTASINLGFISVFIPQAAQRYWSPQLTMTIESSEEGQVIRGLYGPKPTIWTMYMFFYFVLSTLLVFVSIIGFSNRSLGLPAGMLWWIPILLLLFIGLRLAARFGERLGRDQLRLLQDFAGEALEMDIAAQTYH